MAAEPFAFGAGRSRLVVRAVGVRAVSARVALPDLADLDRAAAAAQARPALGIDTLQSRAAQHGGVAGAALAGLTAGLTARHALAAISLPSLAISGAAALAPVAFLLPLAAPGVGLGSAEEGETKQGADRAPPGARAGERACERIEPVPVHLVYSHLIQAAANAAFGSAWGSS